MRNICHSMLLNLSYALTIVFFVLAGCSAVDIKKVTYEKADYYKFTSQKAGLRISVDPYIQEDRLKEFFGCDLLSRGVLPVLVVIENQNAEDGYILVKEKSGLVMKTSNTVITENSYNTNELKKAEKTLKAFTTVAAIPVMAMLVPVAGLAAIISVVLSLEHKTKNERAIKRSYEEKQLLDKTIYQGGTNSGFLYFQLNDKEDINKIEGILLIMKNLRSQEITSLIIKIS